MMVNMGMINRPHLSIDSIQQAKISDEILKMAQTYDGYSGRYEIKDNTIYHHIELSMYPNWTGNILERQFEVEGDDLFLRNQLKSNNNVYDFVAHWRRV
jgi:hypothetical protein